MRFILYSKTAGTFIGHSYGGDFFSAYAGMAFSDTAETFESKEEALGYAEGWKGIEGYPQDIVTLSVQTNGERATMAECMAAGAKAWVHHIAWLKEHPGRGGSS